MIVTCPSCRTKFRLDPSRLGGEKAKVRCSQCQQIFEVAKATEDVGAARPIPDEQPVAPPKPPTPPAPKPVVPGRPSTGPVIPPMGVRRKKSRVGLWLALLVLLALLGGGIYLGVIELPRKMSLRSTQTIPVEPTPRVQVKIPNDTLDAYFHENLNAGQIFVVAGEAVNVSKGPLSFILLEGNLYDTQGKVAKSQRCFCGNLMTREELTQLTVAEIQDRMMNREGKDLINVHIPAGGRVPFMVVFHNLPDLNALTDYSIEVVSSEEERSEPPATTGEATDQDR